MDNDQQIFPAHKNDGYKEWKTTKIKCLIAQTRKAHHSGGQVVRDQLAKKIKMEKG